MAHFPTPPAWMRRGPLREGAFRANLHDERTASLVGTALGIAFTLAFVTGVISHEVQHPPSWLPLPTRPIWFYRFTQGLHVASGTAAIPLLLVKLWTVYPRLFSWPPVKSLVHALERLSIAVLVACAIFELVTGLLNVAQWYPWRFPFIQTHFWVAWITVGSLMLHLAIKAPAIARGYRRQPAEAQVHVRSEAEAEADLDLEALSAPGTLPEPGTLSEVAAVSDEPAVSGVPAGSEALAPDVTPDGPHGSVRRKVLLTSTGLAVGAVTLTTVGQSVTSLRGIDLFAPRDPTYGPQHVPINRTAAQAGVLHSAVAPEWRLHVDGPRSFQLSLADLAAMAQYRSELPIACVEGWSVDAVWQGVRIHDLLTMAGVSSGTSIRVVSLERGGSYGVTEMPSEYARDPLTLLALQLNGEPLSIDHGFPARVIAPARPGVLQTKWVSRLTAI